MESGSSLMSKASAATFKLAQVLREREQEVRKSRREGSSLSSTLTTEELLKGINDGLPPEMHVRLIKVGRPGPIALSLKSKPD